MQVINGKLKSRNVCTARLVDNYLNTAKSLSISEANRSTIQLQFVNKSKGTNNIQLVNSLRQVVYKKQMKHPEGNEVVEMIIKNNIAKGICRLQISNVKDSFKTAIPLGKNSKKCFESIFQGCDNNMMKL